MEELSLLQIKQIELNILKNFDLFCREHNIQYMLSNGTLLGAIKYKGFIPWDDDIDVFVPREDYDRLLRDYSNSDKYELLCKERNKSYVFPFAKLSDTTTLITNQTTLKDYHCGVHIDIFPLDYWPEDINIAKKQAKKIQALCHYSGMSIARLSKGRTLFRTCFKIVWILFARLKGYKRVSKHLAKETNIALNNKGKRTCGCVVWPIYGDKEIHPATVFSEITMVEFEGEMFPAPIGYDTYLRNLYGDYVSDPPLEKQKSHHKFIAHKK